MSFRQDEKSKMCTNNDNVVQVKRHCMETGHTAAPKCKHDVHCTYPINATAYSRREKGTNTFRKQTGSSENLMGTEIYLDIDRHGAGSEREE